MRTVNRTHNGVGRAMAASMFVGYGHVGEPEVLRGYDTSEDAEGRSVNRLWRSGAEVSHRHFKFSSFAARCGLGCGCKSVPVPAIRRTV